MSVIPLKVVVRVRPLIPKETDEGCQICTTFIPYEPQIILGKDRSFTYDFVFRPNDPQISVYEDAVKPLVEHIFKGYNSTVLAYGQTGSGKTFTMGGGYEDSLKMDPEGMGIIPRIIQEIFTVISEKEKYKYTVKVSYLEIINEDLQDLLLNNKKESLSIREENGIIKIPGLKEVPVEDTQATMKLLELGCNNRTTAATAMNNTSSRSHAIFSVIIEQQHEEDVNDFWKVKLQLVDLAGSERIKKTHAEGARLKEGININKGLLALGNVISILGDETKKAQTHVPYRDSKLTRILQDSLGGNSHTLMIACVSPADSNMEETLNTLRYADRARKIKNKPVVNWDPQTAEIMRLKEHVQQLTMKLIGAGISDLDSESDIAVVKPETPNKEKDRKIIQMWIDKCHELEEEVTKLHSELQQSVDQCVSLSERAITWEMKCDRLKTRLKELEDKIGVDLDLLSSSITEENNPVLAEQIEKLKTFANKLHETVIMEEDNPDDSLQEGENSMEAESDVKTEESDVKTEEVPATPETLAIMKQHTLRRARMNNELEELNKILEKKEKLASQMTHNDEKMLSMKQQYEETMKHLEDEISNLQKEKNTLSTALEDAKVNKAASKVSEQRRMRMKELEEQMTDLKKKLIEQKKMLKMKDQSDKQVTQLNTEIQALKQQRVKLMKQMKEDADQWRKMRQQKDKEVLQLQQKDRKRQFEIQKLQRENQRTQTVLQRKSEEASAANRRLKEALAKQKQVISERNQKFEKCDKTAVGNRVRKWLSYELDVQVSIMEAKYHRESLLQDRKVLAEQLKDIKESVSDEGPPAKKMSWMDDSGRKHETSFQEEEKLKKVNHLQQQIEFRNVQISELQQKIFDAEQECKGKTTKDNLHTMMEAKIAIKWLLDQAVSYKADNNRIRLEMNDQKESLAGRNSDNDEYITELEDKIDKLKKKHEKEVTKLESKHQKEIKCLLESQPKHSNADVNKLVASQQEVISRLTKENEALKKVTVEQQKTLTKYMYTGKTVALMPEFSTDENTPPEARSPFLNQRPKAKIKNRTIGVIQSDTSIRSSDEFEKPPIPRRMKKSVSAGMIKNKKSAKSTSETNSEDDERAGQSLRGKSSRSNLPNDLEAKNEALLKKLRKRSSRFDLKDILATDDDETEEEEFPAKRRSLRKSAEVKPEANDDANKRPLRKKSSKTNLKVDSEESDVKVTKKLRKRSSRLNLKDINIGDVDDDLAIDDELKTKTRGTRRSDRKMKEKEEKEAEEAGNSLNSTFTCEPSSDSKTDEKDETQSSQDTDVSSMLTGGVNKKRKLFSTKESFFQPVEFSNEVL